MSIIFYLNQKLAHDVIHYDLNLLSLQCLQQVMSASIKLAPLPEITSIYFRIQSIYIYIKDRIYIYIYKKRQNIYVCMSSHLLRNYWTEFNQFLHPPLEVHGNLNKKYLTDRSIFEIDMLIYYHLAHTN